jgi:peptidyl-prolyl cis-trans isomerase D
MTAADEKNIQSQVLTQMINNEVTLQAARHYGFNVSIDQANGAILNIAQFQEDGHFSSERYQQALSGALFTPETFQKEVRQGMLLSQQRFAFMGSSFALPSEIERYVRLLMQTRDYDYLTIHVAPLEKKVTVTPHEIDEYYKDHQKEFMSPEQVSIEYVTLSMRTIRSKIKISDEDISRYYNDNESNYLTPAKWKVAHILFAVPESASSDEKEQIKNKAEETYQELQKKPDSFDKLLSLSDDKLSLPEHGLLPWITAGQSEYNKILSPLYEVGQISAPEETKHGFEIFKLVDYKPVTTKSLVDMKATIEEQLSTDMVQAQYAQALEQLSDLSYQTPDSLEPVASTLGLKINYSKPFSRLTGTDVFGKNKQIVNSAFSHDVLELGNNSEPVQLNNDAVVVLRIKEHIATKELPLHQVQDQIKTILAKNKAESKAKEIGSALLNPVEDKKQLNLIAAHQLKWNSVAKASRDNDKANNSINELAFNLLRKDSRDGTNLENGDYVVVRLKQINDGTLSAMDKEQKDSLIQQIEASYGMMDYDLYVNSLINHAQIERH